MAKSYKKIIDQTLFNYNYIELIIKDELKVRSSNTVVTHDMGSCLICEAITNSGMFKLCDSCLDKYKSAFKFNC